MDIAFRELVDRSFAGIAQDVKDNVAAVLPDERNCHHIHAPVEEQTIPAQKT